MTGNSRQHRPSDEERAFFEAIVGLRRRYQRRGADDATAVVGLHHAIVSANAAMAGDVSHVQRLDLGHN